MSSIQNKERDLDARFTLAYDLRELAQLLIDGSIDYVDAVARISALNSKLIAENYPN